MHGILLLFNKLYVLMENYIELSGHLALSVYDGIDTTKQMV
jgi:hypothetical protein